MKISDLELCLVEVPRVRPLPPLRRMLVRLATESGHEGWGETEPVWRPEQLAQRQKTLLSALVGRSVYDIEELLLLDTLAAPALRLAVETACWDIAARATRQPLSNWFGGSFRRRVPVLARLPAEPLEVVPYWSRELAAQGYHAQLVASTGSVDDDLAALAVVREMAGPRCRLALDAGNRYDMASAVVLASQLSPSQMIYVLDPLEPPEPFRLAHLRRQVQVELAASTQIAGSADVLALAGSGVSNVIISPARCGGLLRAYQCGVVAAAAVMSAALGGRNFLGVGMAALLQLAAALPGFTAAHETTAHQLLDDIVAEPLEVVDGMMTVPTGPGLGIEVDGSKLERYQIG
jgi:L-alanine-DL-glutamate epimerase-like enolase superfamily enzyme